MVTLSELEEKFPDITWRDPVTVRVGASAGKLCCRVCIARKGLKAKEVDKDCFATREDFDRHFAQEHGDA